MSQYDAHSIKVVSHPYLKTGVWKRFTLRELFTIFRHGLYIGMEPEKRKPIKEWLNGKKVITINNEPNNLLIGKIVDEDYQIHGTYMPVIEVEYSEDPQFKQGAHIQTGGNIMPYSESLLNSLKKLEWWERWNLVSNCRAGVYGPKKDLTE